MADTPETGLVVETEPDPQDTEALGELLYGFGVQATGIPDGTLLAVYLRDAAGAVTGGGHGWTWGGTCYVRYLYLPQSMRGRGLGTRIMAMVEREALARGCTQIVLETHDFQAPGFYRKLGFCAVATIGDYPRGHRFILMRKTIPA